MSKKQAVWLGRFLTGLFPGFHRFIPRLIDGVWIMEIWVTPNFYFHADSCQESFRQVIDVFNEDSGVSHFT